MFNNKRALEKEQLKRKVQECHEALDRTHSNLLKFVRDNNISYPINENGNAK